jgi:hypothetical protein
LDPLSALDDLALSPSSSSDEADEPMELAIQSEHHPAKKVAKKKAHKRWSKNLLSFAEHLDVSRSLPKGLETDWNAVVTPKGKRCLAVVSSTASGTFLSPLDLVVLATDSPHDTISRSKPY